MHEKYLLYIVSYKKNIFQRIFSTAHRILGNKFYYFEHFQQFLYFLKIFIFHMLKVATQWLRDRPTENKNLILSSFSEITLQQRQGRFS